MNKITKNVAFAWLVKQGMKAFRVETKTLPLVLQKALKAVSFRKPDIAVEGGDHYRPSEGSSFSDGNQGFLVVVNLGTERFEVHVGDWGGPGFGNRQVDMDDTVRPIPPNGAVIMGSHGGRGNFARIRVHPQNLQGMFPAPAEDLSPKEKSVLAIIDGITSSYRQREFEDADLGDYNARNPLILSLVEKGMLKMNNRGSIQITLKGKNAQ